MKFKDNKDTLQKASTDMATVTEIMDSFPVNDVVRRIERNEELLLTKPGPGPMKLWRDYDLLRTVTMPTKYFPSKFAPPLGVYESDYVRIEMAKNGRSSAFLPSQC
jgi:hypothetical protein